MDFSDPPLQRRQRERLVRDHLPPELPEPIREAMRRLPRHWFMPEDAQGQAYVDAPVPIGAGQTISQPSLVAHMLQVLRIQPGARVLDVGAGSGYTTALLALLAGPTGAVFACERQGSLARRTQAILEQVRAPDWAPVRYEHADAAAGWPAFAPYDAIHVGAAFPSDRSALAGQLAPDGHLIQPVTSSEGHQILQHIHRRADGGLDERVDMPVRFVPVLPDVVD